MNRTMYELLEALADVLEEDVCVPEYIGDDGFESALYKSSHSKYAMPLENVISHSLAKRLRPVLTERRRSANTEAEEA